MEALGPVLILVSLPLWFRLIPPNRVFGLRIAPTMRSDAVWYAVNASTARDSFVLGVLMVALEFMLPAEARVWTLRIVGIVGLALVVGVNWYRAYRLEREQA